MSSSAVAIHVQPSPLHQALALTLKSGTHGLLGESLLFPHQDCSQPDLGRAGGAQTQPGVTHPPILALARESCSLAWPGLLQIPAHSWLLWPNPAKSFPILGSHVNWWVK